MTRRPDKKGTETNVSVEAMVMQSNCERRPETNKTSSLREVRSATESSTAAFRRSEMSANLCFEG
jgi:hypothetical protein